MRTPLFALLAVGVLLGANAKEDAGKELKKLEGTWKVTAGAVAGKPLDENDFKGDSMVIKGNKLSLTSEGKKDTADFTFTIDPSKKPNHIDMTDVKMKKTVPCIYALEGDELKLCIPLTPPGKSEAPKRPESFDGKDKPQVCFTTKKVK